MIPMKSKSNTSGLVSPRRSSKSKSRRLGDLMIYGHTILKNSNFYSWKVLIFFVKTWMTMGLISLTFIWNTPTLSDGVSSQLSQIIIKIPHTVH